MEFTYIFCVDTSKSRLWFTHIQLHFAQFVWKWNDINDLQKTMKIIFRNYSAPGVLWYENTFKLSFRVSRYSIIIVFFFFGSEIEVKAYYLPET